MEIREALEELRLAIIAPNNLCPQHVGLRYRLCDFAPECNCVSCRLTAIELYLRGEINFGEIDEGR